MRCHELQNRTIPLTGIRLTRWPVVKPDAKSPYQRYGKREYLYSSQHREWQNKMGRKAKAERPNA